MLNEIIKPLYANEIIKSLYAGEKIIIVGECGAGKTHLLNQIREALIADNNPSTILAGKFQANSEKDFDEILDEIKQDKNYTGKNFILMDEEDKFWLDDFKFLDKIADKLQSDIGYVATMQAGRGMKKIQEVIADKNVTKYFSKIIVVGYPRRSQGFFIVIDKKDENTFNWAHFERLQSNLYY